MKNYGKRKWRIFNCKFFCDNRWKCNEDKNKLKKIKISYGKIHKISFVKSALKGNQLRKKGILPSMIKPEIEIQKMNNDGGGGGGGMKSTV